MSLALIQIALRAAWRARLLTCVQLDAYAPGVSVTLAQVNGNGVLTRASGSWLDTRLDAGQEITLGGFTGSPIVGQVLSITATDLVTNIAGAETVASGATFTVALPAERSWEGDEDYRPTERRPFVSESFRSLDTEKTGLGSEGTIRHDFAASASLFYPAGFGANAIEGMAGALMHHFRPGLPGGLTRDGISATIRKVSRSTLMRDGEWLSQTVTADLLSWTNN